jgi:alpha-amylase
MKVATIFQLILIAKIAHCQFKNSYIHPGRSGIVQLFEWTFKDVAKECQFLGENGYGAVHLSPVHESKSDESYSWHLRYQPLSYVIKSRSGSADDLKVMIQECTKHKIRVYVDIVANHMANGEGEIIGTAKNTANPDNLEYPSVPYTHADFNENCEINADSNAFQIRNCRIDGLPDLNLGVENVRDKISDFMNELIDLGVAGFRMDSVSTL